MRFLLINECHLALKVLLNILITAEPDHLISLSLHMVLSRVFIDDLTPEFVLLLILDLAEGTKAA